ncbi:MAG: hypothetical protein ACJ74Q_15205 [Pyrinomonadaceae bacterium]
MDQHTPAADGEVEAEIRAWINRNIRCTPTFDDALVKSVAVDVDASCNLDMMGSAEEVNLLTFVERVLTERGQRRTVSSSGHRLANALAKLIEASDEIDAEFEAREQAENYTLRSEIIGIKHSLYTLRTPGESLMRRLLELEGAEAAAAAGREP